MFIIFGNLTSLTVQLVSVTIRNRKKTLFHVRHSILPLI